MDPETDDPGRRTDNSNGHYPGMGLAEARATDFERWKTARVGGEPQRAVDGRIDSSGLHGWQPAHNRISLMNQETDAQVVAVFYKSEVTRTGTDIYTHVQCFKAKRGEGAVSPFRRSAPFVLSRWYESREVVLGSVFETLRNIRRIIEQLSELTKRSTERLESLPKGAEKAAAFEEYEREIINTLVLVSCLLRNVFEIFPAVGKEFVMPMFEYDETAGESIKMHVLLDLFVHNRYIHLHNEYITDLLSSKPPKGTPIARKFMGYRFKVNDYLKVVQNAIHGVTLKHLATKLRSGMARLTVDTPHHEMVFLIQNIASFSRLLEALLPVGKDVLWDMLYGKMTIPKEVIESAKGREAVISASIHAPRVRMGDRVDGDNRTIVVSVKGTFRYTVEDKLVHTESADREKEVEYGEFFDRVIKAGGDESLLTIRDRKDGLTPAPAV